MEHCYTLGCCYGFKSIFFLKDALKNWNCSSFKGADFIFGLVRLIFKYIKKKMWCGEAPDSRCRLLLWTKNIYHAVYDKFSFCIFRHFGSPYIFQIMNRSICYKNIKWHCIFKFKNYLIILYILKIWDTLYTIILNDRLDLKLCTTLHISKFWITPIFQHMNQLEILNQLEYIFFHH